MLVSLVPTHISGMRRRNADLAVAAPLRGHLAVPDWAVGKRLSRMEMLESCDTTQIQSMRTAPLFDVEIERMAGDEMWLTFDST